MNKITCVVNDIALENSNLLCEHGLSFWIETAAGTVLFDTGQTSDVLSHNLIVLGLDLKTVNALALSHAHYDHTGGLETVLAENPDLPIYAHPEIFRPRYARRNNEDRSIGVSFPKEALSELANLNLSPQPVEILPFLWTTGEITERSEAEGRSAHHFLRAGDSWRPDDYQDDMSLVLEIADGLVLICGCCHAGLLNTLLHVRRVFKKPVYVVVGGTHLLSADGPALRHIIEVLSKQYPQLYYFVNHCTGEDAIEKLAQAFGEQVAACPAGTVIDLDDYFS